MNRWLSAGFVDPAAGTYAGPLPPGVAGSWRRLLVALCELAGRLSGVIAVAVLGAVMVALALRAQAAEDRAQAALVAAPVQAFETAPAAATPPARFAIYVRERYSTTTIFYLYATADQRDLALMAESTAAQEAWDGSGPSHYFQLLDAGSLEAEQAARDTIFEAMLANPANGRVVVQDLRGVR